MKIGIFDSGIGGLSVLHQAMLTLPEADYIFYADVDHVPYGDEFPIQMDETRNVWNGNTFSETGISYFNGHPLISSIAPIMKDGKVIGAIGCDYDASKAGVISLTHNFARELAPNITVNCICPGWVKTPMNKDLSIEQIKDIYTGKIVNWEQVGGENKRGAEER